MKPLVIRMREKADEIDSQCSRTKTDIEDGVWGEIELLRDGANMAESLADALAGMLALFGKPHREEYVDGGASYERAIQVVTFANEKLTAHQQRPSTEKP